MSNIPTFCDGNFHGYIAMDELNKLKDEAYELSAAKQKQEHADHMIYGYFDTDEHGKIKVARLYSGLARTDAEFERTAAIIPNSHIYAIHKHE